MEYKHFSHQNNLNIHQLQQGQQISCSGCDCPCCHIIHACWQCNFFLRDHCANTNRYVKHPSHRAHPLTLLSHPTYCSATFLCNACGLSGKSFTYCCAPCEVDLHVHCAFLPPKVTHTFHHHELGLIYCSSATIKPKGTTSEFCKICTKVLDPRHWSYSCDKCEFGVHTFCATSEVALGLYQEDNSDDVAPQLDGPTDEVDMPQELLNMLSRMRIEMEMAQIERYSESIDQAVSDNVAAQEALNRLSKLRVEMGMAQVARYSEGMDAMGRISIDLIIRAICKKKRKVSTTVSIFAG